MRTRLQEATWKGRFWRLAVGLGLSIVALTLGGAVNILMWSTNPFAPYVQASSPSLNANWGHIQVRGALARVPVTTQDVPPGDTVTVTLTPAGYRHPVETRTCKVADNHCTVTLVVPQGTTSTIRAELQALGFNISLTKELPAVRS